jgi:hypothetical protein
MLGRPTRYCWQQWELTTQTARRDDVSIRARATDQAGRAQPERGQWNRLGYGNNAIQTVFVRAV